MDDLQSDAQLLSDFIAHHNDEAFSTLIRRHAKAAYSAVVMETGTENLAEEACQLTFLQLAKEAKKLRKRKSVAGWVFLTSRNYARNLRREEIRRRKREERYMEQKINLDEEEQLLPESTRPLIIGALDKLKPLERDLVVLRYFKNLSFTDLGNQLGLSPDAARMRVQRSLEKLNHLLKRKGITSSIALLANTIASQGAQPVPSSFITNLKINVLATKAGTSAASITTSSIIIMKTKIITGGVAAASLLVGTTVYLQNTQKENSENEPSQYQQIVKTENPIQDIVSSNLGPKDGQISERKRSHTKGRKTSDNSIRSKIPAVYLEQAALMLKMLEIEKKAGTEERIFSQQSYDGESKKDALAEVEIISLRLGLNQQQKEKLSTLVSGNFDERQSFQNTEEPELHEVLDFMKDKDAPLDLLALMILEEKTQLEPDLQAYYDDLQAEYEKIEREQFPEQQNEGIPPNVWKTNAELLEEIGSFLNQNERQELELYLKEQAEAEIDRRIFTRVDDISSRLGLTTEEKADLRTFLEKNPNASQDEISEIFTPELQEVLKKQR